MRRTLGVISLGIVLAASGAMAAGATPTDLDATFGDQGRVVVLESGVAGAIAIDGDSVLVAGGYEPDDGRRPRLFVARLDEAGAFDPTWSGDGVRIIRGQGERYSGGLVGLGVDDAGRVLLAAQSLDTTAVLRLTDNGDLDPSFSGDGRRTFRGGAYGGDALNPRVVTDSGGRIVLGAMVGDDTVNIQVWRMTDTGALDPTWSGDGVRVIDKGSTDYFDALAVDGRDRVLVGSDLGGHGLIYRLRPSGAFDTSFSADGLATFRLVKRENSFPLGIEVADDGRITIPASGFNIGAFGAVRMLGDGTLDATYGDGGVVSMNCQESCMPIWGTVSGGRVAILVDSYTFNGSPQRLARISPAGTRIEQMTVDPFPKRSDEAYAIALDGRRVVFGGYARAIGAYVARID